MIDTRGFGNQFDPLEGRVSEDDLYIAAELLLFERNEGEGKVFTQRATKMLTLLFLACREVNRQAGKEVYRLLPFVREMADLGLNSAAGRLNAISPDIARRFLDGEYNAEKDYAENKFLASSWESLTARLYPLLTEKIARCFNGSDFTGQRHHCREKAGHRLHLYPRVGTASQSATDNPHVGNTAQRHERHV